MLKMNRTRKYLDGLTCLFTYFYLVKAHRCIGTCWVAVVFLFKLKAVIYG